MSATMVLDVGKTVSKISVFDETGTILERVSRTNQTALYRGIQVLDVKRILNWLLDWMAQTPHKENITKIFPVAHGAGIAIIQDGQLLQPPLDYEASVPFETKEAYWDRRGDFALTGSPRLPNCLNLGLQLYWLEAMSFAPLSDVTFMPWAQYWAWVLSGVPASEVTSLGCHTDLWHPFESDFSRLAKEQGWDKLFARRARADDILGPLRPELAERLNISAPPNVYTGIHDSNAALFASRSAIEANQTAVTVVSTGTWFVTMGMFNEDADATALEEARDCLINVDFQNKPVPSARFMGGRELEQIMSALGADPSIEVSGKDMEAAIVQVIAERQIILPSFEKGVGPHPEQSGDIIFSPDDPAQLKIAAMVYLAFMTGESLDLVSAQGDIVVEGRFAQEEIYVRSLAALYPERGIYTLSQDNDVSFGAWLLANPSHTCANQAQKVAPFECDLIKLRESWTAELTQAAMVKS